MKPNDFEWHRQIVSRWLRASDKLSPVFGRRAEILRKRYGFPDDLRACRRCDARAASQLVVTTRRIIEKVTEELLKRCDD